MVSRGYKEKSVNTNTLLGKSVNGDFVVTRAGINTLTTSIQLQPQDVTLIEHLRGGNVIGIYGNGVEIDVNLTTITITQYSIAFPVKDFEVGDTFIVYTNISRKNEDLSDVIGGGLLGTYLTAGIDTTSTQDTTYIGKFKTDTDDWIIMKIDGNGITYANVSNNSSYTNYSNSWTDRTSLTYDLSINF